MPEPVVPWAAKAAAAAAAVAAPPPPAGSSSSQRPAAGAQAQSSRAGPANSSSSSSRNNPPSHNNNNSNNNYHNYNYNQNNNSNNSNNDNNYNHNNGSRNRPQQTHQTQSRNHTKPDHAGAASHHQQQQQQQYQQHQPSQKQSSPSRPPQPASSNGSLPLLPSAPSLPSSFPPAPSYGAAPVNADPTVHPDGTASTAPNPTPTSHPASTPISAAVPPGSAAMPASLIPEPTTNGVIHKEKLRDSVKFGSLLPTDMAAVVPPSRLQQRFPKSGYWASFNNQSSITLDRRRHLSFVVNPPPVALIAGEHQSSPESQEPSHVLAEPVASPQPAAITTEPNASVTDSSTAQKAPSSISDGAAPTATPTPPPKQPPSSWAALFKSSSANGQETKLPPKPVKPVEGPQSYLTKYAASFNAKLIRPRGLINNGNMCFMNAILQPLVHCVPFYNLVRRLSEDIKHTFKSKTPLLDAMIIFFNEFEEQGPGDNKKWANSFDTEAFAPEYVYDALRSLKKLSSSKGRQEDAEEFLGFILDGLHEELLYVLHGSSWREKTAPLPVEEDDSEWVEVGPKNRTLLTRQTQHVDSPITQVFGGQTRSTVRCTGRKDSVLTEPFLALQLDITPENVRTIEDAIYNMTRPEVLEGFGCSDAGVPVDATKQSLLHHLPPILILHLKRFIYNSVGGTQKLRTHVGFTTVLKIKSEWSSSSLRGKGVYPEYRLFAVVNHHGKFAAGGHYTCDVHRQNQSWLRVDDAVLTDVTEEEVTKEQGDRQAYMLFYARS